MEKFINGIKVSYKKVFSYKPNPKIPHGMAFVRYEIYQKATHLFEYLKLADPKYANADLRYDESMGFLKFYEDGELLNPKGLNERAPKRNKAPTV